MHHHISHAIKSPYVMAVVVVRRPAHLALDPEAGILRIHSRRGIRVVEGACNPVVGSLAAQTGAQVGSLGSQLEAGRRGCLGVVVEQQQEQQGKMIVRLERQVLQRIDLRCQYSVSNPVLNTRD